MKSSSHFPALLLAAFFVSAMPGFAHAADDKTPDPKDVPTAAQRAAYPLKTCLVSGDDLDEMGHPVSYTYKEYGKPDRVVLFCCKDCVADFQKEPTKYLKKLDEAEAKKAKK